MNQFKEIIDNYLVKVKKILNEELVTILNIVKNKEIYKFPAVYIIYSPKNKIIYVGKTMNLQSRTYRHIYSNGTSCLNVIIEYFNLIYKNPKQYKIRFLQINNNRIRGLFENFLISLLKPQCNKVS